MLDRPEDEALRERIERVARYARTRAWQLCAARLSSDDVTAHQADLNYILELLEGR
jgi:hypothetical protein